MQGRGHFDAGLGFPGRAAEQVREVFIRHAESGAIVEVLHIHPEGSVFLQINQVIVNGLDVFGLPVRRKAHNLVLRRVHLETGKIG